MNLQDLKEQFKDNLTTIWERIQENPNFNTLKENFEVLPASTQKLIVFASAGFGALLIALIPYSFISTASGNVAEFEDTRSITRRLLKSSTLAGNISLPTQVSPEQLKSKIKNILTMAQLNDDQIEGINSMTAKPTKFVPKGVNQEAISISLKKLNLNQIVDVAHNLNGIGNNIVVLNMNMSADNEDKHYYNTKFEIRAFSFAKEPEVDQSKGKTRSNSRRNKRRNKDD